MGCDCCEWPACKRCCFCIPIRFGLLILARIKLIFSPILAIFLYWYLSGMKEFIHSGFFFEFIGALIYASIYYFILEFLAQLVLIVGALMRDYKIIQICFYYGFVVVIFNVLFLLLSIICGCAILFTQYRFLIGILLMVIPIQLISIALNVYQLTLVQNEMVKLRDNHSDNHQFRFVNNAVEAVCTVTIEDARRNGNDLTHGRDHPTLVNEDKNGVEMIQQN